MSSAPTLGFNRVKSGKSWTDFAAGITVQGITGDPPTQLCLFFKTPAMTEAFMKGRPSSTDVYLTRTASLLEFEDGTSGVQFFLADGAGIIPFVNTLLQARYGEENVVVVSGVVAGLPKAEKSALLGKFGVTQGMGLGSVLMW